MGQFNTRESSNPPQLIIEYAAPTVGAVRQNGALAWTALPADRAPAREFITLQVEVTNSLRLKQA